MANINIENLNLPSDVLSKLAELDLELSEGDITQKGYEKKRRILLTPFLSASDENNQVNPSPSAAAHRRAQRRVTRVDNRYHSDVRTEAVMQALALNKKQSVPMPSKRISAAYKQTKAQSVAVDSSSEDDSSVCDQNSSRECLRSTPCSEPVVQNDSPAENVSFDPCNQLQPNYSCDVYQNSSPVTHTELDVLAVSRPQCGQPGSALADVVQIYGHSPPLISQPPDLTSGTNLSQPLSSSSHPQSSHETSLPDDSVTRHGKVSAKIQQLLNTLKRPKRRPLKDFFTDEEDSVLESPALDPNAPKPEGSTVTPTIGEQLIIPSGLPRNLEAAVQRYGAASYKATCMTVLDQNGRLNQTLFYGKLLERSQKIAYNLHKVGSKGEPIVKPGDRVALVFPNSDPLSFICAFYGCLTAGIVPVPIEVPLTKRDAGGQAIGFLLGSLGVSVALTSDICYKGLPKTSSGEVITFRGWPQLHWFVTEHLSKPPKDWLPPPRPSDNAAAYIEYSTMKDGSVLGVTHSRSGILSHCRALTVACNYTEGEVMICVLDFKRDVGLWHGILTSVFNGMHVIFIPYSVMKTDPASWMKMVTRFKATVAVVKSRDMHWGLMAQRDHKEVNLSTLRMLLVADGANPWSLTSCDSFLAAFEDKGLKPGAVCPCATSPEAATVSIRRPCRDGTNTSGRGILSMQGLSYGVVRVNTGNNLTSLTLQDCGQVLPGGMMVVVKLDGSPLLCKTDEVGELCLSSNCTGTGYWGLQGISNSSFKVSPIHSDGRNLCDNVFVRTGLLGFLGPGGLIFVCGSREGLIEVGGRRHNTDDVIATVLAVEPMKFIYRARIAVFSIRVLKDERIIVIGEQRPDCSEEESFQWMSRVLQAVDSIHQVGIYCLALVPPNYLPKTALGGVHLSETKRRFLEGSLHPVNVLMCPHTCVTNLPKPREQHPDVTPSAVHVGNIVQGIRLAAAQGRDLGLSQDDSASSSKNQLLASVLQCRAATTPSQVLFSLINAKGQEQAEMTCIQLHKRAERISACLLEKAKLNVGDHVALIYQPGLELISAFYGCLYAGVIPVTVRPPSMLNLATTLPTVKMIVDVSKSVAILSSGLIIRLIKSKEAAAVSLESQGWPLMLDTDDLPKRKPSNIYQPDSVDAVCYVDFTVLTTGTLAGVKISHIAVSSLCRSMKLQCELYPSREVVLCLDPYSGLGFVLWCLSSVFSGHRSLLIPPSEVEINPALWLSVVSQRRVRDTFCSYGVMELCTRGLGTSTAALRSRGINLSSIRILCVIAEERPRIQLMASFTKLFSSLGLSPRVVSTSFGCRVSVGVCLQCASNPDPSSVYVDLRALRNDRVTLVEKGSPHSLCLMESGKLLPGVKVVIANPETKGHCADSHLGEIWVHSAHSASAYVNIQGDESENDNHFNVHLATGDTWTPYCRTGFLGFVRRTEMTQSDGELHDALFVVGAVAETLLLRGMRYHPIDIENSIIRSHRRICECAVFTWTNLLVVVVELDGGENEALDIVPLVTNAVLEEHYLIIGVVVIVDPGIIPINSRGEKQRVHLREGFLEDRLDPIYVAYNM